MRGAYIVTEGDLTLTELTEATANTAVGVIASYATDRADLLHLLDVVRPTVHQVAASPSVRRAAPRRGVTA